MSPNTPETMFATPDVQLTEGNNGIQYLTSRVELEPFPTSVSEWLKRWATTTPDHVFLAERADSVSSWATATYAEVWNAARHLGQSLLELGLSSDRPLAVLSGPSIAHAQLMLAAHLAGIPYIPVSVAYSLVATDLSRVRHILDQTKPGLIFVEHTEPFKRVLNELDATPVCAFGGEADISFDELAAPSSTRSVDDAFAIVRPGDTAKILFTSGSTGPPKGVITTHHMLCSNQQAMAQLWPFLEQTPPVLCDWLPWSHTFGSSHNFNMVLANGGTLYIDNGKPAPGLFDLTVANLVDVRPTISVNVPVGYARLVERLEAHPDESRAFFSRLQLIFYAAAALSQDTWERLEQLSLQATGRVVPMTSSWGLTETAPAITTAHFALDRAGVIGTPLPGVTLKLLPSNDKVEIRVTGDPVTPGYFNDPERTKLAFDDEGFFITGDAVKLADPDNPNAGLVFDGRVAEDFKLATGTWVSVGTLRPDIITATSPLLLDCVVTGHGSEWLGLLVWLAPGQTNSPELRDQLRELILAHNAAHNNTSSTRIRRLAILDSPPSIDAGEVTDKGYVNQRGALANRASTIERLHAGFDTEPSAEDLIDIAPLDTSITTDTSVTTNADATTNDSTGTQS